MKLMKTNKRAISLIVLVITIIVMIILAGAIILTLSNTGIIEKASYAIDVTNLNEIKEVANLLWANAYAEGIRDERSLATRVVNGLNEIEGLNVNDYITTVTTSGVTLEKASYVYYSTLVGAVNDINNNKIGENDDATETTAVAGVRISNETTNETPYVVLLKDSVEESKVEPRVDMTINLGGHALSSKDAVGIDIYTGHTIIDGVLQGSIIEMANTNSAAKAVQVRPGSQLTIKGGKYTSKSTDYSGINSVIFTGGTTYIYDAIIDSWGNVANNRGIENHNDGTITIVNSKITATSIDGECRGIFNNGIATITNCEIEAMSTELKVQGVATNAEASSSISGCNIISTSKKWT